MLSCPLPCAALRHFTPVAPQRGGALHMTQGHENSRARQQFGETYVNQKPADPSLNLQFVDEALNLVRERVCANHA